MYIINVDYINRLIRRFVLQTTPTRPDYYTLPNVVVPVTNADELLRIPKMQRAAGNLDTTGYVTYFSVPKGKRWRLLFFDKQGSTVASAVVVSDGVLSVPISLHTADTAVHQP